ncbi:TPM domain-containing protein [Extensimonas sp. H3M7-6]|uniref:TPM domain-containing protein n=1 Tax=Extensimonas soli TaxID=3031322 RepID=UPI0023DC548C|nr:TPM domain-containing protein [Extensimonas sp. H3M7-6]MDF1481153.1 TPM domain-containing protein [Extensimonas sp. H3M7-6]
MQSFFRACKALPRLLRHRWYEGQVRRIFPEKLLQDLAARVQASERQHTGQIRIAIEGGLPWSYLRRAAPPRERAVMLFGKLRVWDTAHNNGVLIYLLLAERAIDIVADRGLAQRVPAQQWQDIVARMAATFRAGQHAQGLALAIDEVHALLVQHFPAQGGEARTNELPDRPVII